MKALALFSGGLDSMLAVKIIREQGIDVTALNFNIGFGATADRSAHMERMAKLCDVELKIVDVRKKYLDTVLFSPKYGYGSNFNPCIDCHGSMFKWAGEMMEEEGASFVISGEVLGERPMSQRADALVKVEKISGIEGLILRPLSAKLMKPTLPEEKGWVDREQLLDLQGRGRKRQLAMAAEYGWEDFESPGGGCLLTDPGFGTKMKEFVKFDTFTMDDLDLMKTGRHMRLPGGAKLVLGRNQEENETIKAIESPKYLKFFMPEGVPGPVCMLAADASEEDRDEAVKVALTYAKAEADENYTLKLGYEERTGSPYPAKADVSHYLLQF